jgi:hypothetical protein
VGERATGPATEPAAGHGGGYAFDAYAHPVFDDDFGLLDVAAIVDTADTAEQIRAVLADAGIRATVAPAADGRVRVLVFETEVARARRVVGGSA